MPDSAERTRIKTGFLAKSQGKGPRNAVGCIDGCHVEILRPSESAHSYYNCKKFPSIVLQGVCNHENKFLDMFIGFLGSAHDARVMRESPFFTSAPAAVDGGYILGDSPYLLLLWLMTPYKDNSSNFPSWKKEFNKRHSQQRVAIENTFSLLKQRFRRFYLVDAKTVAQSCFIVMAACGLHNVCNEDRDYLQDLECLPEVDEVGNDDVDPNVDRSQSSYSECLRRHIATEQC
ncbi:hypothetical protein HPB48_000079 [Haemaphysalis longicornis]|uniref:DDE Tnp4 domain-containing protein n=1 Tax=Haemaphysalis longicornis TaxID=44386 RepID=A0A9J6G9B4_HAELO|nr:hypothetical protein HPB48_000079 [Haemaphysalis longicornis]